VLERLKDQLDKNKVDQELLDRLGWSKDDLAAFVRRWEEMRRKAGATGDKGKTAKGELDATLRALGLSPRASSVKSGTTDDAVKGVKESRRSRPPAQYLESSNAYTQGTARGQSQPVAEKEPKR
jgi:collagen type III alpha